MGMHISQDFDTSKPFHIEEHYKRGAVCTFSYENSADFVQRHLAIYLDTHPEAWHDLAQYLAEDLKELKIYNISI